MQLSDMCQSASGRYSDALLYCFLWILERQGPTGWDEMSEYLSINASEMDQLVSSLRTWGAIIFRKTRFCLSDYGKALVDSIPIEPVEIHSGKFVKGSIQYGVLVRGKAGAITNGVDQRNHAVSMGAVGASLFSMSGGSVMMPPLWNLDEMDPAFASDLRRAGLSEGDVLIIAGAEKESVAMVAAVSTALSLV